MMFYPPNAVVPDRLEAPDFILRPLTVADCERDLEAMRSRPSFAALTFDDNYQDLARHEKEHRDSVAFTYAVFDAANERCLGCLYIKPMPEGARELDHEGLASFWVRPDLVVDGFEQRLFDALLLWLRGAFAFGRVALRAHWNEGVEAKARQASMFERAGLRLLFFAGEDIYV
jgi:hypothetical protein